MAHGPYVKKEQVIAVKKALEKGTSISFIAALTGRSTQTICRIKGGDFDWMLKDPPPPEDQNGVQKDIRDIGLLLHTIANQNEQIIGILDSIRKAWLE